MREGDRNGAPSPCGAVSETFGQWLKARREERGLTLRDVERITGGAVSNPALSQVETGKIKNPSLRLIDLVACALGLSWEEVHHRFRHDNQPPPPPFYCECCGQLLRGAAR